MSIKEKLILLREEQKQNREHVSRWKNEINASAIDNKKMEGKTNGN